MVAEPRGLLPGSQLLKSLTDLGQGLTCGILDILGQMTLLWAPPCALCDVW